MEQLQNCKDLRVCMKKTKEQRKSGVGEQQEMRLERWAGPPQDKEFRFYLK